MCVAPIQIEISPRCIDGIRFATVPCGKCEECRELHKNAWSFRIGAELQEKKRKGWLVAFGTLTYNEENLPHVPKECFTNKRFYEKIQCFNREHLKNFFNNIRKRLFDINKNYVDDNKLVFFGASEYGGHTKRCHYHYLLSWNPALGCTAERMFELVNSNWRYGFHYPRYINGGIDKHGYEHKPFIVTASAYEAARYCAKYVCKDMFFEHTQNEHINKKCEAYKNCKYFHMQSKSIGLSVLSNMSAGQKIELFENGYQFAGEERFIPIPTYIKNKLIFNNKYIYVDEHLQQVEKKKGTKTPYNWKRLCVREATEFFKDNIELIYNKQKDFYETVFRNFKDAQYCVQNNYYDKNDFERKQKIEEIKTKIVEEIRTFESRYGCSFSDSFIAYGCRDYNSCFNVSYPLAYLSRFELIVEPCTQIESEVYDEIQEITRHYYKFMHIRLFRKRISDETMKLSEVDDYLNNFFIEV